MNKNRNPITDRFHAFGTVSRALYDGMVEIFCKLGVTVRPHKYYERGPGRQVMYYGSLVGRSHVSVSKGGNSKIEVTYSGMVYCCTVPNGLLFVRRNELVCVSGNSFLQQKLLGTPVNLSGRAQVLPNPSLDLDQIGIPESVAWEVYHPFAIRRLVRQGVPRVEAAHQVADQGPEAKRALLDEMEQRPILATRYPVLHKYNVMAFRPQLVAGDALQTNHLINKSYALDHDGDAMTLNVPLSDEAVREAYEKLLPSKNLFSAASFKPNVYLPNLEYAAGLHIASTAAADAPAVEFPTRADALRAYRRGEWTVDTRVHIKGE